jgi:hypothetical protein
MPRVKLAADGNSGNRIMGKAQNSYTVEQLQRLLQEFGTLFTKQDNKSDLIAKLRKHVTKHPQLTSRERDKILKSPLDIQHIRWQVMDENGNFKIHAYPPQITDLLNQSATHAVMEHNKVLVETNARQCIGCVIFRGELDFPNPIASCCKKLSKYCRKCIEKDINGKISGGVSQAKITCLMCHEPLAKEDVQPITTVQTFEK